MESDCRSGEFSSDGGMGIFRGCVTPFASRRGARRRMDCVRSGMGRALLSFLLLDAFELLPVLNDDDEDDEEEEEGRGLREEWP